MQTNTQVIVVNSNAGINGDIERSLKASGFIQQVKVVLNGGQALLYLDHLSLSGKIRDYKILLLLNMNTPIMDGMEFFKHFRMMKHLHQHDITISVIDDHLSEDKKEKAKSMGVKHFITFPLSMNVLSYLLKKSDTAGTQKSVMGVSPL